MRVDRDLKECADSLFERLGMNMTTALNVFFRFSFAENAIPFSISSKPIGFGMGYTADEITRAFSETVVKETAHNYSKGFPVARYDAVKCQAYLENADGTREYVTGIDMLMNRGALND
jgi:DNA-damage-inducible protein J